MICAVAICCCSDSGRSVAQLIEQSRILDCDDGLVGEILYQPNALVGEGASNSPSFSMGTARIVRTPPSSTSAQLISFQLDLPRQRNKFADNNRWNFSPSSAHRPIAVTWAYASRFSWWRVA
jgi:hypothetical protein